MGILQYLGHLASLYLAEKSGEGRSEAIIGQAMDFARIDQKTEELLEIFNRAPQVGIFSPGL